MHNGLSVTQDTTVGEWFDSLKQYGIVGSISDKGIMAFEGDNLISGNLATALGLDKVLAGTDISGTVAESNALAGTTTTQATMTSSLKSLGINSAQTLTIKVGATTKTHTFATTATLQDVANAISAAGGSMTVEDGILNIEGVDKLSGSLVERESVCSIVASISCDGVLGIVLLCVHCHVNHIPTPMAMRIRAMIAILPPPPRLLWLP